MAIINRDSMFSAERSTESQKSSIPLSQEVTDFVIKIIHDNNLAKEDKFIMKLIKKDYKEMDIDFIDSRVKEHLRDEPDSVNFLIHLVHAVKKAEHESTDLLRVLKTNRVSLMTRTDLIEERWAERLTKFLGEKMRAIADSTASSSPPPPRQVL